MRDFFKNTGPLEKWVYSLVTILGLMTSMPYAWSNTNDDMKAYHLEGLAQKGRINDNALYALYQRSLMNQKTNNTVIEQSIRDAQLSMHTKQKPQGVDGAVLFVSFSMPESLLFQLSNEAAQFNIPVVINGLVDNDFKKTIATFKRLNDEAEKQHIRFQGLSIDPLWFTQFHIDSVPALLVTRQLINCSNTKDCGNQPFDVVFGNASITKGLELIAEKGRDASVRAQDILRSGHV